MKFKAKGVNHSTTLDFHLREQETIREGKQSSASKLSQKARKLQAKRIAEGKVTPKRK